MTDKCNIAKGEGGGASPFGQLRLSPIELRNQEFINDPALAGYSLAGKSGTGPDGKRLAKLEDALVFGDFLYVVDEGNKKAEILAYRGHSPCVDIPAEIDRCRVSSLASGLFEGHEEIEDLVIPPSVENLGNHVFAGCRSLRCICLPEALGKIPTSVFAGCSSLETIVLSAPSVRIECGAFDQAPVRRIELGELVRELDNVAADLPCLEEVLVSERNPFICTDGLAIFSRDGVRLLRLVVQRRRYAIPEGCVEVAERAFDSMASLERVDLPHTLRFIGRLAFAKTSLAQVSVPSSVEVIGEKAFFHCALLSSCLMSEGLRAIGSEAFSNTTLLEVRLPASLEQLGCGAFAHTPAQKNVALGAISIAEGNKSLEIDHSGGVYAHGELVEVIGLVSEYRVRWGTHSIARGACRRHVTLQSVELPETLEEIGPEAFRGCHRLEQILLPGSLESIGAYAFAETAVRELRISRKVYYMGEGALLVRGEGLARSSRPLRALEVDADNPVFYKESGLLCERGGGHAGGDLCLLYVGPENIVRIPDTVNRIAPSAFCGATGIDELFVHSRLHSVCQDALSTARPIPVLHVSFPVPIGGFEGGSFSVPGYTSQYRCLTNLVTTDELGTVFNFAYYDAWVSHAPSMEEFAPAALSRLMRPLRLLESSRDVYIGIFMRKKKQACRFFSKRGDYASLEALCNLGILDERVVSAELEEATGAGEAQATACLLELRRRRGWRTGIDFGL